MFVGVYLAVALAAAAVTYVALFRRTSAGGQLAASLTAGVLWYVWAQAGWTVETASAGEIVASSYPTLAVIGYVAAAALFAAALVAAVEVLDFDPGRM